MRGQRANSTAGGASGQLDAGTTACFDQALGRRGVRTRRVCGLQAQRRAVAGQGHRLE